MRKQVNMMIYADDIEGILEKKIKIKGENMKKLVLFIIILTLLLAITGCGQREAEKVSYNLSLEADNFNVVRQLTVINCITDDVLFQMTGKMSIEVDAADGQLEVVVEDENGNYQKHFVGLGDNTAYICEDTGINNVSKYKYTLNYNPKMWLPLEIKTVD